MEFMLTAVRLLALHEALLYKLGDDSLAGKSQKHAGSEAAVGRG